MDQESAEEAQAPPAALIQSVARSALERDDPRAAGRGRGQSHSPGLWQGTCPSSARAAGRAGSAESGPGRTPPPCVGTAPASSWPPRRPTHHTPFASPVCGRRGRRCRWFSAPGAGPTGRIRQSTLRSRAPPPQEGLQTRGRFTGGGLPWSPRASTPAPAARLSFTTSGPWRGCSGLRLRRRPPRRPRSPHAVRAGRSGDGNGNGSSSSTGRSPLRTADYGGTCTRRAAHDRGGP